MEFVGVLKCEKKVVFNKEIVKFLWLIMDHFDFNSSRRDFWFGLENDQGQKRHDLSGLFLQVLLYSKNRNVYLGSELSLKKF